jgi:hypothetical protein
MLSGWASCTKYAKSQCQQGFQMCKTILPSFRMRIIGYKAVNRRSIFVLQKQERNREREFEDAFENRVK